MLCWGVEPQDSRMFRRRSKGGEKNQLLRGLSSVYDPTLENVDNGQKKRRADPAIRLAMEVPDSPVTDIR
jgi:hypothetical protein